MNWPRAIAISAVWISASVSVWTLGGVGFFVYALTLLATIALSEDF